MPALVDSGASGNFIDKTFIKINGIPTQPKVIPEHLTLVDGSLSRGGDITREAQMKTQVEGFNQEDIIFQVTRLGSHPIILGYPWLQQNNPIINWTTGAVTASSGTSTLSPASSGFHLAATKAAQDYHRSPLVASNAMQDNQPGPRDDCDMVPADYHTYLDVFSKERADTLPPHRPFDHTIPIEEGKTPPFGPIYSLSETELKALKDYLEENLKKGFIQPSESPAAAPILFVKKKDGSLRLCVDYRGLNKITIKNRYPLPLIAELLDRLRQAKYYTKIDLRGAYNLLRIAKGEEWKTAFRTRYGLFEYLVMPFGLTNAPATFQHLMNHHFTDMMDKFVICYLDDILIYSNSLEEHKTHVAKVLQRLREAGLYAKAEKCEFHTKEVEFLGFVVDPDGIKMDKHKVQTVLNWPTPKTLHDVRAFLGFANFYRRFIKNYSSIAHPLTQLTRKGLIFDWKDKEEKSFQDLKHAFLSDGLLYHFDPDKPLILETDASDFAVAGILSQQHSSDIHPIAFFSRKMVPAELNYEIHDKEMLAIISCFKEWRHYLEGAQHTIEILTDHRSLEFFTTTKQLNRRQARWSEFLADFNFVIKYRPGTQGTKPDALTRRPDVCPVEKGSSLKAESNPHNLHQLLKDGQFIRMGLSEARSQLLTLIKTATAEDQATQDIIGTLQQHPQYHVKENGLLYYKDRIFVPDTRDLRLQILQDFHDSPRAGHPGRRKTIQLVQRSFAWPSMKTYIHHYVDSCQPCSRAKARRHKPYGELKSLPIPPFPWSAISMDFIEQLPPSKGYDAILVIVDRLTKMAAFIPTYTSITAEGLAELFTTHIFSRHGIPESIVCDRGSEFTSRFWRSLAGLLDIKMDFSTAYHPETDGQTERTNQTLEQYLRIYGTYNQDDWATKLPTAEFAYNNAPHASTGLSPFFANKGYNPRSNFTLQPATISEVS